MKHLTGIHGVGYSRDRACRATGLSSRTIDRAVGELVQCGAIAKKKGGDGQPSKISVLITLPEFLARLKPMARLNGSNGASEIENGASARVFGASEPAVLNNACASETQTQRKEEKQAGSLADSSDEKVKPFRTLDDVVPCWTEPYRSRGMRNPEYVRIAKVLHGALDRIRRADNPAAYEWAIIERESAGYVTWQAANRQQEYGLQGEPGAGSAIPGMKHSCCPLAESSPAPTCTSEPGRLALVSKKPPQPERDVGPAFLLQQIRQLASSKSLSRRG